MDAGNRMSDFLKARSSAMLRAIPDLMFVLRRDGTYVDYHARDAGLLFVPPDAFLGRNVRDVLPAPLSDRMMDAIERACRSDEPVVVDYELSMDEQRFYEARIVRAGGDLLLSIVRDVTEARRASALTRDLAGRLIARQEMERQRIARDLHDDVSQRLALLSIEIDLLARHKDGHPVRAGLAKLSAQVKEVAEAVHEVSYELHPSKLQALGLAVAVRSLCDHTSTLRNLRVTFTHDVPLPPVDANVSLCLYRIVQEALHNAVRHSGASAAGVNLTSNETEIAVEIADSGVGFDLKQLSRGTLGLASMQERVALLKGHLAIDTAPRRGTRISVRIPLFQGAESRSFLATT